MFAWGPHIHGRDRDPTYVRGSDRREIDVHNDILS